jgi:hypothetical protein
LGYFYFQQFNLYWDNDEQLNHSRKVNCWDTFLSTIQLVLGIMMEPQPVAPEKVNCWDILSTIQLVLG